MTQSNLINPRSISRRRFTPARRMQNFGYDAVVKSGKRRMAAPILRSEDYELLPVDRKQLTASLRDLSRNFAVFRWLIERHLDYCTNFKFKFRSANKQLNKLVETRVSRWCKRTESDVARRHPFQRCLRLAESSALLANDCLAVKLADRRIQWIEGDRLANPGGGLPPGIDGKKLVHGVQVDDYGAAVAYCVCRRGQKGNAYQTPNTLIFEEMVEADDAILHGFYDRFDQVRGVSPLACALNSLQDVYEAKTYALGRMKVDQIFAMAVYRGSSEGITERADDGQDYTQLPIGNGPLVADMDIGDRIESIQSSQPSSNFQEFMQKAIAFCLKALAIPYSFFDESYTNYSGARQALLQYEAAADKRREALRELLDDITDWLLQLLILDGELPEIDPADYSWEWVSASLPWIDPMKEAQANIALIGANLESEISVLKSQGRDLEDIIAERKLAMEMIREAGLQATVEQSQKPAEADPEEEADNEDKSAEDDEADPQDKGESVE